MFLDLGFPESEAAELKVKAELAVRIHRQINELGLTQAWAARRLGIGQPDVSKLVNGRLAGFSVERLLGLLNALEVDVDIVVRPRQRGRRSGPGVVRVVEAAGVLRLEEGTGGCASPF